jgi:RNA polymerase sigma factor (sigma-70 family)
MDDIGIYYNDLYNYALFLTHNREDSEDLIQDTCLKDLTRNKNIPIGFRLAWLKKIMRNTHINQLRKKSIIIDHNIDIYEL